MDKYDVHEQLCKKCNELYRAKNSDYGDSFHYIRKKHPNAILIRLEDKFRRVEAILENPELCKVKNESIDDTLFDLACYALMEITERKMEKQIINWEEI